MSLRMNSVTKTNTRQRLHNGEIERVKQIHTFKLQTVEDSDSASTSSSAADCICGGINNKGSGIIPTGWGACATGVCIYINILPLPSGCKATSGREHVLFFLSLLSLVTVVELIRDQVHQGGA